MIRLIRARAVYRHGVGIRPGRRRRTRRSQGLLGEGRSPCHALRSARRRPGRSRGALGYAELRSDLLLGQALASGDLFAGGRDRLTVAVLTEPEQGLLQGIPLVGTYEHGSSRSV